MTPLPDSCPDCFTLHVNLRFELRCPSHYLCTTLALHLILLCLLSY